MEDVQAVQHTHTLVGLWECTGSDCNGEIMVSSMISDTGGERLVEK